MRPELLRRETEMAKQRNHRGFTRTDALVGGVICLVLVVLVPALLARPREQSSRRLCAANLAQIGKTMFVYANDYEDELPRAGGRYTIWGPMTNWMAPNRYQAFGLAADGAGGTATINSSLYLLAKYYEAPTRLFLCPGDNGTTEFKLSEVAALGVPADFELIDAWDFGPRSVSYKSCSFAYHHPYNQYSLMLSSDPNMAVAADRNPWIKSPAGDGAVWANFKPDLPGFEGTPGTARNGNAYAHYLDGQNVLFLDGRVSFETRAYCGRDKDNIYTPSAVIDKGDPQGYMATGISIPSNRKDSLLVHDPDNWGGATVRR
jgi:hypothetical protein